jgi:hypothetical protein
LPRRVFGGQHRGARCWAATDRRGDAVINVETYITATGQDGIVTLQADVDTDQFNEVVTLRLVNGSSKAATCTVDLQEPGSPLRLDTLGNDAAEVSIAGKGCEWNYSYTPQTITGIDSIDLSTTQS